MHADHEKNLFIFADQDEVIALDLIDDVDISQTPPVLEINIDNADLVSSKAANLLSRLADFDASHRPAGAERNAQIGKVYRLREMAATALREVRLYVSTPVDEAEEILRRADSD